MSFFELSRALKEGYDLQDSTDSFLLAPKDLKESLPKPHLQAIHEKDCSPVHLRSKSFFKQSLQEDDYSGMPVFYGGDYGGLPIFDK